MIAQVVFVDATGGTCEVHQTKLHQTEVLTVTYHFQGSHSVDSWHAQPGPRRRRLGDGTASCHLEQPLVELQHESGGSVAAKQAPA